MIRGSFIYVFEDGEIKKSTMFSDDEAEACDAGILDAVDISGDEPKMFFDGKWHDIQSAG